MPPPLELLAKSPGLKRVAPAIAKEALPCVRLSSKPASEGTIEIGASKLGGLPDLPDASEWPHRDGAPLSFIAQINVTALPKFEGLDEFPPNTLLSFFYDTANSIWGYDLGDKGGWRVLATPISSGAPLKRLRRPSGLADEGVFEPCELFATLRGSLPDPFSRIIEKLELTKSEEDAYFELFEDLVTPEPQHQWLGHAKPIQTDGVEFDCQLVADGIYHGGEREAELCRKALESACEWKLLLQVASDDNAGMVWGDLGRLYYCIKRDSLRRGSFDDVWLVLQTT